MKILIADDDSVCRSLLESVLLKWGYDVVVCADGPEALLTLQQEEPPDLAILDWMMPGMDGTTVCRSIRNLSPHPLPYLVLLTTRSGTDDVVEGLEAGADEYIVKPFDVSELRARVSAGARIVKLQAALTERVKDLEAALAQVKQLHGLLPICSYCKSIRDDQNYWEELEAYLCRHTEARFSHGICPSCYEKHVQPQLNELSRRKCAAAP
jgi:phosphoserine phosphatase RsbU/P